MLLFFPNCHTDKTVNPHQLATVVYDNHETWVALLDKPFVAASKEEREARAGVLCGAQYFSEAIGRSKKGVDNVTCLVLDVDAEHKGERVPNEAELRAALLARGHRAIVYASASHTKEKPRWRVLVPLASPLKPAKHKALVREFSDNLVPGFGGCISAVTGDCTRLGFVGVTFHPEDYTWWEVDGPNFDWTQTHLVEEDFAAPPINLERSDTWSKREDALDLALKHDWIGKLSTGSTGGHRSLILWEAALQILHQWAAEDDDFVLTVLEDINANFPEPKNHDVVILKMQEARHRIFEDRVPQKGGLYGWRREPDSNTTLESIKQHAKRLKQRKDPKLSGKGDELLRIVKGETITDNPKAWAGAVQRCAKELAATYTNEKPEIIAGFFKASLSTMTAVAGSTSTPTLEEIEGWIEARQEWDAKRKAALAEEEEASLKRGILFATGNQRDHRYSADEVETWKAPNGVGLTDRSWIVVAGRSYFVFLNGTWVGPYTDTEFEAQGYTDLLAADPHVVTYNKTKEDDKKTTLKINELLQKYSCKGFTKIDFRCDKAWFDVSEKTLMLAGPPKLELDPRFHPEVDQWLRVMTGRGAPENEQARVEEAACDRAWVVRETSRDAAPDRVPEVVPEPGPEPVSALGGTFTGFLAKRAEGSEVEAGGSNAGSTEPRIDLAKRFAKLGQPVAESVAAVKSKPKAKAKKARVKVEWSQPEADDDYDTICNWLACLTELAHICAALYLEGEKGVGKGLFADGVARIWKNGKISLGAAFGHFNALLTESPLIHVDEGLPKDMSASVLLRRTLAAREHEYTRKYKDSGKVTGCVRILFTANNLDIFSQDKEMVKKEDVDALADRFAHIKIRPAAAAYLESLGHRHHDFVEKNMLAEHALWLNEQRWPALRDRDLRFLVKGKNTNVSDVVATNSAATSNVCNTICAAILEAKKVDWLMVKGGVIFVQAAKVQVVLSQPPWSYKHSVREVTRALSSISLHKRSQSLWTESATRFWSVRQDALRAWCENTLVFNWEDVRRALDKVNT